MVHSKKHLRGFNWAFNYIIRQAIKDMIDQYISSVFAITCLPFNDAFNFVSCISIMGTCTLRFLLRNDTAKLVYEEYRIQIAKAGLLLVAIANALTIFFLGLYEVRRIRTS